MVEAWGVIRWDEEKRKICVGVKPTVQEAEKVAGSLRKNIPGVHVIIKRCNCGMHGCCDETFPCMGNEGVG